MRSEIHSWKGAELVKAQSGYHKCGPIFWQRELTGMKMMDSPMFAPGAVEATEAGAAAYCLGSTHSKRYRRFS